MASFSTYLKRSPNHCRSGGNGYLFVTEPHGSFFILTSCQEERERFRRTLACIRESAPEHLLKNSRSVQAGLHDELFIKYYRPRGVLHGLKRYFQLPRPFRCLAGALHLQRIGIPTPEVFFAERCRDHLLTIRETLITAPLPADARLISRLVEDHPEFPTQPLLQALAELVATMHDSGMEHGDLSLRNLYLLNGGHGTPSFVPGLIDLDGCCFHRHGVPPGRRCREAARILSSYLRYRRAGNLPEPDYPALARSFVEPYENKTGIRLDAALLRQRTEYLTNRIRAR